MTPPRALDPASLGIGVQALTGRDPELAGIVDRHGRPPLWDRPAGFETLVRVILEQQVSLRSAEAALARLTTAAGTVTAAAIARTGEQPLRDAGLTRQKSRYLVALADDIEQGRFDPAGLAAMDDDDALRALTARLGVGRWTADIYLLMALGRPDVWPTGDLALAASMRHAKGLATLPTAAEQLVIADTWRPWRAVAARILWHAYLSGER